MKKIKINDILRYIGFDQPNLNKIKILIKDIFAEYHLSDDIRDFIALSINVSLNQSLSDFWKDKYLKINLKDLSNENVQFSTLEINNKEINLSIKDKLTQVNNIYIKDDLEDNNNITVLTDNIPIINNYINTPSKNQIKRKKISKRKKVNHDYISNDPNDYNTLFFKNDYMYINKRKLEVLENIKNKADLLLNNSNENNIKDIQMTLDDLLDLFNYSVAFYDTQIMMTLSLYIMKYYMENNIAIDDNFNISSLNMLINTDWISNYDKAFLNLHYLNFKNGQPYDKYINNIENYHKFSHKFSKINLKDINNE